jgi:hypothetical protein
MVEASPSIYGCDERVNEGVGQGCHIVPSRFFILKTVSYNLAKRNYIKHFNKWNIS